MQIRELDIPDSYEITPVQHADDRGVFLEWYRFDRLSEVLGHPLRLAQANTSVSRRGTVRGVHFAELPPSQAKYVTATRGAVIDFIIDIRVGSPSFGQWDSVRLDDQDRRAVYVAEGLGHCFVALTDEATVSYLVSEPFAPGREHGITPLDPELGLDFGIPRDDLLLSPKDLAAPTLAEAQVRGLLPDYAQARAFYQRLAEGGN